jgi:hypothetical protein
MGLEGTELDIKMLRATFHSYSLKNLFSAKRIIHDKSTTIPAIKRDVERAKSCVFNEALII